MKVTLDSTGKVTSSKVLVPSKSASYDKSITEFLETLSLTTLPYGLTSLDLYLTFMADPTMSMVEYAELPEADTYYENLVGRSLSSRVTPSGLVVPTPISSRLGAPHVTESVDTNNTPSALTLLNPQKDVDLGPYMADVQRRIKRAWFPPKGNETRRVVVQFQIHKAGELSNLRIDHSSGLAIADQAALKAVEDAAPFRPISANVPNGLEMQFTFDYNVFGGGGHGSTVRVF